MMIRVRSYILALCTAASACVWAQESPVQVHGNVQFNSLLAQEDEAIGAQKYDQPFRFNTYADFGLTSKYVDAGLRFEFMEYPMPGYEPDFKGWGVPNLYVKGKFKGFEVTAGSIYEQFGSGRVLRLYEDRPLGIDNALSGARLKVNAINGVRLTVLGGTQRRYWHWDWHSQVYGADAEVYMDDLVSSIRNRGAAWMLGASYVLNHPADADIRVTGTDFRLNLPSTVSSMDFRTRLTKGAWSVLAETAFKGQDPTVGNAYTYRDGSVYLLSASYSRSGLSALVQAQRNSNFMMRSQRTITGISAMLNNMPAFAYQHTYSLAAMYPYATQSIPGEWAYQAALTYKFKRGTAMGGKYGTTFRLNASYVRGLDFDGRDPKSTALMGTDGPGASFFGWGDLHYQDVNLQMEKRISRDFNLTAMYMNQLYNKTVVEGEGGKVRANIFVLEGKFRLSKRYTLRAELQYLTTRQDARDWAFGMVELSVQPYLMFTLSDMWNCGGTGDHYYMAGVTGNYRNNRLMISYGRTREGINCSGGVCRMMPATHGLQLAYTYNF